jgi:hypothetical protein
MVWVCVMKRLVLAVTLLVVGGTASAAIFAPAPAPLPSPLPLPKIGSPTTLSAPEVIEAHREPVPLVRRHRPPAPQIASLTEPPPDFSQIGPFKQSAAVSATPAAPPRASIGGNPDKMVRDLTSGGNCKGRTLTSVSVLPDGRVIVQC